MSDLSRFEKAHDKDFAKALAEIKHGRKTTHWMWYIFPQIKGLGFSQISKLYAINDLNEAQQFFDHPTLGKNLLDISNALLALDCNNATAIFGKPDDLKLQSCMTLFSLIQRPDAVFQKVLQKFYNGREDVQTMLIAK